MPSLSPVKIVISGVNRASMVLGKVGSDLHKLGDKAEKVGRSTRKLGLGIAGLGIGAAAFTGLTSVPGQMARIEHGLLALKTVGGLTRQQMQGIGKDLRMISRETNQFQEDLLRGVQILVAKGMDPLAATQFIQPIGKAATAAEAEISDLSEAAFAVHLNLGIMSKDLTKALNVMAASGKEGSFELKDMARAFPSITAQARTLGIVGVSGVSKLGAALQVALQGAAGPEEATVFLSNFLNSITSMETRTKFAKAGINIRKVIENAMAKDLDPIEEVIKTVQKHTGGDPFKMGELFTEKRVLAFVRKMSQGIEEYRRIRDKTFMSDTAIQEDFNDMMDSTINQWKKLRITMQTADIKPLTNAFAKLNQVLKSMNGNSETANKLLIGIGGSIAAGGTLIILGQLAMAIRNIGAVLMALPKIIGVVRIAMLTLTGPVGLIVGGAAALGFLGFKAFKNRSKDKAVRDEVSQKAVGRTLAGTLMPSFANMPGGPDISPSKSKGVPKDAMSGKDKSEVDVNVNFSNLPRGASVDSRTRGTADVNTEVGLAWQ